MTDPMDWDEERDWVLNNPLEAHDIICRQRRVLDAIPDKDDPVGCVARIKDWVDAQGSEMSKLIDKFEMQQDELRELRALRDAIPGDDKLATVQWAVKIAAETINCRTTDEPAALTRFYDAWSSLSPSVRAALRGEA